jgi:hypothetical protein
MSVKVIIDGFRFVWKLITDGVLCTLEERKIWNHLHEERHELYLKWSHWAFTFSKSSSWSATDTFCFKYCFIAFWLISSAMILSGMVKKCLIKFKGFLSNCSALSAEDSSPDAKRWNEELEEKFPQIDRDHLPPMNTKPSFSVTPVINGTWLYFPRLSNSIGWAGRNGCRRSESTRGPKSIVGMKPWYLYLTRTEELDSLNYTSSGTEIRSAAFLVLRHSNCSFGDCCRQPSLLVREDEYCGSASGMAHGHRLVPDWAIALWNSPAFRKWIKFRGISFPLSFYAFGMRWQNVIVNACSSSAFTEDGHRFGISSKVMNMILDPFESHCLIQKPVVTRSFVSSSGKEALNLNNQFWC